MAHKWTKFIPNLWKTFREGKIGKYPSWADPDFLLFPDFPISEIVSGQDTPKRLVSGKISTDSSVILCFPDAPEDNPMLSIFNSKTFTTIADRKQLANGTWVSIVPLDPGSNSVGLKISSSRGTSGYYGKHWYDFQWFDIFFLASPTLLSYNSANGKIDLQWSVVAGAEFYNIYRGSSLPIQTTYQNLIGSSTIAYFSDRNIESGKNYYYVVSAVASGVESEISKETYTGPPPNILSTQAKNQIVWPADMTANDRTLFDDFDLAYPITFEASPTVSGIKTWDFGDGTIVNESYPTHSYTAPGNYFVTLTNNFNGAITKGTASITVLAFANIQLGVNLQYQVETMYGIGTATEQCASFSIKIFHQGKACTKAERFPTPGSYRGNWGDVSNFLNPVLRLPISGCSYQLEYRARNLLTSSSSGTLNLQYDGKTYPPATVAEAASLTFVF